MHEKFTVLPVALQLMVNSFLSRHQVASENISSVQKYFIIARKLTFESFIVSVLIPNSVSFLNN